MRSCARALTYVFLVVAVAWSLSGCVYPAPGYGYYGGSYYGGPAYYYPYYYGPPAYGSVWIGGGRGWHHGWR